MPIRCWRWSKRTRPKVSSPSSSCWLWQPERMQEKSLTSAQGLLPSVLVTEAMKMETEIRAPIAGTVAKVLVRKGDAVNPDETLIEIVAPGV